jgi:uncharacterized protein involved in high-affinity Fe2+ transport
MKRILLNLALASAAAVAINAANAAEYPIGKPVERDGMEVAAVYLQPIEMDPPGMMRAAKDSDIHLEADIHALAGNVNGFPEGEWLPHLTIQYEIQKVGSSKIIKGDFMPMVASDGPHYGDNIKLEGPGKYKLKFTILPPGAPGSHTHFGRHTDKETGVEGWFKPFSLEYEFPFAGTGKKGGY